MNVILLPLEGIERDGEQLLLGASREEVRGSYYYFRSEPRLDFDAGGRVEFIAQ